MQPIPPHDRASQRDSFVQTPVAPGHSTDHFDSSYELLSGFHRIIPTIKSYFGSDCTKMSGLL